MPIGRRANSPVHWFAIRATSDKFQSLDARLVVVHFKCIVIVTWGTLLSFPADSEKLQFDRDPSEVGNLGRLGRQVSHGILRDSTGLVIDLDPNWLQIFRTIF
jgi:hypothetical protein